MKFIRLFLGLFIVSAIFFTACSHPDTTKVTVYFAKNGQASLEQQKLPLIDRFLNLFSNKAYAQTHDPANTDYYFLWVTADDIDGIYTPLIPGTQTSVNIDVPSGNNRVFTILSFHGSYYNYLGQTVANLTGSSANIIVNMYPCVNDINISLGNTISWAFDPSLITEGFLTLNIYRACYGTDPSCDGTVTPVITSLSIEFDAGSPITYAGSYEDFSGLIVDQYYYYFIRINSPNSPGGGINPPSNFEGFFTDYYFISAYMIGGVLYNP